MATEISPVVGSGSQQFRQENPGAHHRPGLAVNVLNWEDAIGVIALRTSGLDVVGVATRLPSGVINLPYRRVIAVLNTDTTADVYVGGSGVTVATGYPVKAGTEKAFSIGGNLDLWAIANSGTSVNVRIMEIA